MIDNMINAQKTTGAPDTKMYLYSGHESNVAGLLKAFDLYEPHVPQYSSAVITELQKLDEEYYVKVSEINLRTFKPLILTTRTTPNH